MLYTTNHGLKHKPKARFVPSDGGMIGALDLDDLVLQSRNPEDFQALADLAKHVADKLRKAAQPAAPLNTGTTLALG